MDLIRAFIVGSSLPASIYTLSYVGRSYGANPTDQLHYPGFAIAIPLLFGLSNAIVSNLIRYDNTRLKFALFGACFGLVLASIGLYLDLPVQLFDMEESLQRMVLLIAPLLYAVIWAIPIYQMNLLMLDR